MSEIEKLFGKDVLKQICDEVGDTDEQEVARVLESVLPHLHEEYDNGNVAQRAAAMQQEPPERGLGTSVLLPLLLGGNLGGATSLVSQSTGVSQKKTGSILKIAAPLLLAYLLKKKVSQSQQQAQLQQLQQLQQQQQHQQAGGLGLLSALFGGGQQQHAQQQSGGLFNLFGGQQQSQQQAQMQQLQQLQQLQQMQQMQQAQQHHQAQQHQQQGNGGFYTSLFGGQQGQSQQAHGQSADLLGGILSMLGGRGMPEDGGKDKK